MQLSIVIPTYNEAAELPKLMHALKNQTMTDFEVIVADKHSTDDTRKIARDFGAKIVDGGNPSEGRNNGAAAASNEYIVFFDADVVPPEDFLEKGLAEFIERDLDAASCDTFPITEQKIDKVLHSLVNEYFRFTESFFPHAPGFFIFTKRSVFEKVGGFDPTVKLAEDHEYVNGVKKKGGSFGILRSVKIPVSVRRLDKEGRVKLVWKYVGAELHLIFKGPIRSDIFRYRFGHDGASQKDDKEA